jgi:hypothetical protein
MLTIGLVQGEESDIMLAAEFEPSPTLTAFVYTWKPNLYFTKPATALQLSILCPTQTPHMSRAKRFGEAHSDSLYPRNLTAARSSVLAFGSCQWNFSRIHVDTADLNFPAASHTSLSFNCHLGRRQSAGTINQSFSCLLHHTSKTLHGMKRRLPCSIYPTTPVGMVLWKRCMYATCDAHPGVSERDDTHG